VTEILAALARLRRKVMVLIGLDTQGSPRGLGQPLYVVFHRPCLAFSQTGGWGRRSPGRGSGGGANEIVQPWDHRVRSPAGSVGAFASRTRTVARAAS